MRKELIYVTLLLIVVVSACTTNIEQTDTCSSYSGADKDDCYARLAIQTGNDLPNICAMMQDKDKKYDCMIGLMEWKYQPYSCEMFNTQEGKDECNMIIGSNMKLTEKCDSISNAEMKDYCYFENAKFFDFTKEVCSKISSQDIRSKCDGIVNNRG